MHSTCPEELFEEKCFFWKYHNFIEFFGLWAKNLLTPLSKLHSMRPEKIFWEKGISLKIFSLFERQIFGPLTGQWRS